MKEFCNLNGLKSLINELKCLKNPEKPTCIDLILTNRPLYSQLSTALETGFSDFHLLTVTEFKMSFTKSKPRIIAYRDYKKFNNNAFRSEIQSLCSSESSEDIFHIFNKHAPIKKKYHRANEARLKRSRLRNKLLREKNRANRDNYKIQGNLCKKLLRKTKNSYFSNLDTKKITDNKTFLKTVVPLFTNKPSKSENIITMRVIKALLMKKNLLFLLKKNHP